MSETRTQDQVMPEVLKLIHVCLKKSDVVTQSCFGTTRGTEAVVLYGANLVVDPVAAAVAPRLRFVAVRQHQRWSTLRSTGTFLLWWLRLHRNVGARGLRTRHRR